MLQWWFVRTIEDHHVSWRLKGMPHSIARHSSMAREAHTHLLQAAGDDSTFSVQAFTKTSAQPASQTGLHGQK